MRAPQVAGSTFTRCGAPPAVHTWRVAGIAPSNGMAPGLLGTAKLGSSAAHSMKLHEGHRGAARPAMPLFKHRHIPVQGQAGA